MSVQKDFLGEGSGFPVSLTPAGTLQPISDEEKVRQSIWTILSTSPGERVMRPNFGCPLHDLVFGPHNAITLSGAEDAVRDALNTWEPRIHLLDVHATFDVAQPNLLLIEINYEIRATNSRFNLVYPFYL